MRGFPPPWRAVEATLEQRPEFAPEPPPALDARSEMIRVALSLVLGAAAPPPVSLAWHAPAECPGADYVQTEVERLLGQGAPDASISADATASHDAGLWSMRLRAGAGERVFTAASCRELADATAVVLAMAVDPTRVLVADAAPMPLAARVEA